MDQLVITIIQFIIGLADKHEYVAAFCLAVGALYLALSALRGVLTLAVKLTKTKKDDKVIACIFAFLDKFAYGFGKFAEYFETHAKAKKEETK